MFIRVCINIWTHQSIARNFWESRTMISDILIIQNLEDILAYFMSLSFRLLFNFHRIFIPLLKDKILNIFDTLFEIYVELQKRFNFLIAKDLVNFQSFIFNLE